MPATYKVQIDPVRENVEWVFDIIVEFLGPDSRSEAERLVEEGGTVTGGLNRQAAEDIQAQLEEAGAEARIVPEEETRGALPDTLKGRLRGIDSGQPVEGAEVTIRPAASDVDETFGTATTGEDGTFTMDRFGALVREFFLEARPELQVIVERDGMEVDARPKPFDWEAFAQGDYTFEIEAAAPQITEDDMFTVFGQITRSNGEPASGVTVRAYDRDLRSRQLLGEATTDEAGEYEITYTRDQFRRTEKERADLVLRVFNPVGTELDVETDRDGTIFNAEPEERVDLRINSDELITPSEYEQLVQALTPLLEGVALADLTTEDIEFLHRDTGRDAAKIRFLAQDAQLSQEHDVSEAAFYGFARMGLGVVEDEDARKHIDLGTLLERDSKALREGLLAALKGNIIPARLRDSLDDIIAGLDALRAEQQKRERENWPRHELTGRLLDEETGEPLEGYSVRATDEDPEPDQDLGHDFTDGEGRFTFSYRTPPESGDRRRPIRLAAFSQDGERLDSRLFDVRLDQPEELEWRIELPTPSTPGEDVQVRDVTVGIPDDALAELEEKGVKTLADVRSFGDLTAINGIGDVRAQELRAHANLSVLSSDGPTRASLIEKGYLSPVDIAKTPRSAFTRSVQDVIEEPGRLHNASVAAKRTVDDIITTFRTNRANGIRQDLEVDWPNLEPLLPDLCLCRDCQSAVSPGAYLADLTQYVVDHVREDGNKITLNRLEELFHQPFGDLPVSCEVSKEEVRQVRICIEILLRNLGKSQIQFLAASGGSGGAYRKQAYESLLNRLGTSREELRRTLAGSDEERRSLADRLGIAVDHLDEIVFDPSATLGSTSGTPSLGEGNLEATFGLPAFTYYDPSASQLTLPDPLREIDDPKLLRWRIEHQRHRWSTRDHPSDAYTDERLPRIDPDVIGPDVFRTPEAGGSNAFDIWKTRREWVDSQLDALWAKTRTVTVDGNSVDVPDLDAMVGDVMTDPVTYEDVQGVQRQETPWPRVPTLAELRTLVRELDEGSESARETVEEEFGLSGESLARLVELWEKDEKWSADRRHPRVTESEWREVRSILVQAEKRTFFGWWIWKEWDLDVVLGPREFWRPLRQPSEGRWSSAIDDRHGPQNPFVDPERVHLDELPERTAGEGAIELWEARRDELAGKRDDLMDTYRQQGFDAVLSSIYPQGPPAGHSDWDDYFGNRPIADVDDDLDLADEAAGRKLKSIRAAAVATSPDSSPPSTEELEDVFGMLTTVWKRSERFGDWFSEEQNRNLATYWKVRKARLPKWRASRSDRQGWQQALHRRSQPPIIDPDLLVPGDDFENPSPGHAPYDVWQDRKQALQGDLQTLRNVQPNSGLVSDVTQEVNSIGDLVNFSDSLAQRLSPYPVGKFLENPDEYSPGDLGDYLSDDVTRLHRVIDDAVGVSLRTLVELAERDRRGNSIEDRLAQLTLTRPAFEFLLQVHDDLAEGVAVPQETWEEVYHLLVNVEKKRRSGVWQRAERPTYLFDLDPSFADELDADNITSALRTEFGNANAGLSGTVSVTTLERGSRWLVHDEGNDRTFAVSAGAVQFHQVSPGETLHVHLQRGSPGGSLPHGAIVLSPASFRLADRQDVFDRFDDESPERWRTNPETVRDWRDDLEARIEQREQLESALGEAVSETEEETLAVLRDALVERIQQPDANAAVGEKAGEKAEWASERLLIDTEESGCRETTRVSQAMESLQTLLFSLDSGQDLGRLGDDLTIEDGDFEQRWDWLESYSKWKAAKGVYLYPENLLLPTTRPHQTPTFRELSDPRTELTPERACSVADRYHDYLEDVCSLTVEATCWGRSTVEAREACFEASVETAEEGRRELLYFVARAKESGRFYWSVYDPDVDPHLVPDDSQFSHSFWRELPVGDATVLDVIGMVPYRRQLYTFVRMREEQTETLGLLRYDLDEGGWDEVSSLSVPEGSRDFSAAVVRGKPGESNDEPPAVVCLSEGEFRKHTYYTSPIVRRDGTVTRRHGVQEKRIEAYDTYAYYNSLSEDKKEWTRESWRVLPTPPVSFMDETELVSALRYKDSLLLFSNSFRGLSVIDEESLRTSLEEFVGNVESLEEYKELRAERSLQVYFQDQSKTKDYYQKRIDKIDQQIDSIDENARQTVRDWEDGQEWGAMPQDVLAASYWPTDNTLSDVYVFEKRGTMGAGYTILKERDPDSDEFDFEPVNGFAPTTGRYDFPAVPWTRQDVVGSIASSAGAPPDPEDPVLVYNAITGGKASVFGPTGLWMKVTGDDAGAYSARDLAPELKELGFSRDRDREKPLSMTTQLQKDEQKTRRQWLQTNSTQRLASNAEYLKEAYYFLPMWIARQLRRAGHYDEALDWYRLVYDYSLSSDRKIAWILRDEEDRQNAGQREGSWLDSLNPHRIARHRENVYTQFTLFSIARCLLDYADDEFARDTGESVQRARTLYETALDLLQTDLLEELQDPCEQLKVEVKERISTSVDGDESGGVERSLHREVDRINSADVLRRLNSQLAEVGSNGGGEQIGRVTELVSGTDEDGRTRSLGASLELHDAAERTAFRSLIASDEVALAAGGGQQPMSLGTNAIESGESSPDTGFRTVSLAFCIPGNSLLGTLRQRAKLNLEKIRTCRNFAGMQRELEPYSAPTGAETAVPSLGGDGATAGGGRANIQPTNYRYETLVARAKKLVNLAQTIESSFLSALESRDAEAYKLLQARQDLELARAGVRLQSLRVRKAEDRVELSELQRERAQLRVDTYRRWLQQGMNRHEEAMLEAYKTVREQQKAAARVQAGIQSVQMAQSGGKIGAQLGGLAGGAGAAIIGAAIGLAAGGGAPWLRFHHRAQAIDAQIKAQIQSLRASHARRIQRWRLQRSVAKQNVEISDQRIEVAEVQVDVVEQQREIAETEADQAEETIEFLRDDQFTNVDLFDWMADVLEGVYRYFLQQATTTARLAQQQLAFERQELPEQFVQSGYWDAPREGQTTVSPDGKTPDRRGLTGSARLLRDIYQLDQYAFRTDERKQQVSKTISLARLAPFELQQFRETGVLTFDTYRELFERDFPGHYMRLIKNVSVSVIALTPPMEGIKAELTNNGISEVVTDGPPFRSEIIRRDLETITLSSPQNEMGVFRLEPEGEKLNPFEKTGVDTSWELRMPKAANAFDYDTIADVLLTINYTALQSESYRQQVIKRLDPEQSGQRAFSFSDEFADPWYDLHNPALTDAPMTVRFKTRRADFPSNLDDVEIENVLLYYVTEDGVDTEELKTTLTFTPKDGQGAVGGEATPVEQRVSTRRGNGSPWMPMMGKSVTGEWKLSLPNSTKVKRMFDDEKIEDMLFVITYEGRAPQWPI